MTKQKQTEKKIIAADFLRYSVVEEMLAILGLSHEMDLALMTCMVSSRPKIFRCSKSKSLFFAVNASLRWLNNVSDVYLGQVSLLLINQQGLRHFFRYRPLLPIGWRIVQISRQRWGKTLHYKEFIAEKPITSTRPHIINFHFLFFYHIIKKTIKTLP